MEHGYIFRGLAIVLLRVLMDRGELAAGHGRLMVTLSRVKDLAVVVLTVALPSFSPKAERHSIR